MSRKITLPVLFLLGCATGGIASRLVVPPARAGTEPTRWEYLCAESATIEKMNEAGAAGWELVTSAPTRTQEMAGTEHHAVGFCFKRALP